MLGIALGALPHDLHAQDAHAGMKGMHMGSEPAADNAAPANAQSTTGASDAGHVDDVVVTGQAAQDDGEALMMEVMMKTPRGGDVVTGKQAQQQQIRRLTDVQQIIPNFRPNIAQPRQSRQAIRGVGIAAGSAGTGSPSDTGYMVDNVSWLFAGWQWGNLVDFSSIELILGPTGTAGGHNTNVGTISIRTQLPSFVPSATAETTVGNYNHIIENLVFTGPLIDDRLAYRVTFYVDKGDGWIRDQGTGTTYLDNNRLGFRGQLLGVGDGMTDRLIFNFNASNEHDDYLLGTVGDTSLIYANGTRPTATFFQNMQTKLGKQALTTNPYAPYATRMGRDPTHTYTLSNELNWQIGQNTLTVISAGGYGSFENNGFQGVQNTTLGFGAEGMGGMNTYLWQVSQEVRLSSPTDQPVEWKAGLYSVFENAWDKMHHTYFGWDSAAWLNNPAAMPGLYTRWHNNARDFQIAAYGQTTIHFDPSFALTFGLRDSYDIRYGSDTFYPMFIEGTPFSHAQQEAALIQAGSYGSADTGGFTKYHNAVTGIVNPEIKINDNIRLWGLIGRGDKVSAVNTQDVPIYINGQFNGFTPMFNKPETSWDYEIGVKTSFFDDKWISNVNLYWNDLYNFQASSNQTFTSPAGVVTNVAFLANVPHVRLRGIEFVERLAINEELNFHATGAYTEARYISYPNSPAPPDFAFSGGPAIVSLSNTRLTGIPWWSFSIGYNYEHPVGALLRDLGDAFHVELGDWANASLVGYSYGNVDWFYKTQLTSPVSYVQYWQAPYSIVNAGIGLRTEDNKYSLTLWGKNLFNALPFTSWAYGNANASTQVGISTLGPRFFGATVMMTLW
ncbi:TonB-dependent receptor [Beijerinckia indica]|nr:TonB-dependent receptor plug domain-containing protein [Beijerinckia indica]